MKLTWNTVSKLVDAFYKLSQLDIWFIEENQSFCFWEGIRKKNPADVSSGEDSEMYFYE